MSSDIYVNSDYDAIFLCGDFNARIGSLNDTSEFGNTTIPQRQAIDKTVKQHGHSFLDFLNEAKMCVLNGRFNESDNNFTSVSTHGKAVVDYICVHHDVLQKYEYFKLKAMRSVIEDGKLTYLLGERSKTPDHSALILEICVPHFPRSRQPVKNNTRDRKKYKLNSIPQ